MDESDSARDALHNALQQIGTTNDETLKGSVLTKWLVVREWMTPDGERWLSHGFSASATVWDVVGMCETVKTWRMDANDAAQDD